MMKKLISLVVAAVMLTFAFVLVGCQGGSEENSDALSVWIRESDQRHYVDDVIELYEQETGNAVKVTMVSEDDFKAKVSQAFKEGNGPDVLLHYNDSDLASIGLEDNFLVLNDQEWADSIMAGARAYCDDGNGNLMGLPFWESSVSGCYYNKTILSSLGLKPASTQAEFDMLCQALTNIGYTPLFWGQDCGWMYQFGLDPIFADDPSLLKRLNAGEIDYADIPQVRSMVQWIYDANQKGWLGKTKNKSLSDVSASLSSGESVMVDIWDTWFETDFTAAKYSADDFAIMPVFMGTTAEGSYEGGNLNMMLVNKNGKHRDEAIEFLNFCAQPEVYNEVFEGVPSVKVFKDQDTIITPDMLVEASSSLAKLERASTANPKINGYNQKDMMEAFQALLDGEVDVDGCIAMMDEMRHENMAQGE